MSSPSEGANPQSNAFGPIRGFFWPIYNGELKKFIPLALIQFLVIFAYTALRNTKDALVVNAGGAAVIPFLKGYIVFPASILFVIVYTKLVDSMSKERVFHAVTSFFLIFFAVFGFLIYPNREWLHPSAETVGALKASYPALEHFISIFQTWSFSSFYVMAELWGSVMNALLFWQFANEITRTEEAKRFYAMFILLSNFSTIFAGVSVKVFSQTDSAITSIMLICGSVALSAFAIMAIYDWVGRHVLIDPKFYDKASKTSQPTKKKKVKLSFGDSIKVLLTSKYLIMIMLLVLCYGISINLIELLWKNQLRQAFDTVQDYNNFMGNLSIGTGVSTIIIVLLSKSVITRFGWFWGAVATPLTILVTGTVFFGCLFFHGLVEPLAAALGLTTLMLSVWIGTFQNFFSKAIKYGLFDPTKNMAYIPLEDDLKAKGQAAVEVIGGRLGKACGGYIASGLLMAAPFIGLENSVTGISPILSIFMAGTVIVWIFAVVVLNGLYTSKLAELETEKVEKVRSDKAQAEATA